MFKTLALAASLVLTPVAAQAQNVSFGIVVTERGATRDLGYVRCYRPNGRVGIVADQFGRPIRYYQLRRGYAYGARCIKYPPTRTYDDRYERYQRWDHQYR